MSMPLTAAIEVPLLTANWSSRSFAPMRLVAELINFPGATKSGFRTEPAPGPRLENDASSPVISTAPIPMTSTKSLGDPAEPQTGPALPFEKTGMMPASSQASAYCRKKVEPPPHPQLLFTMSAPFEQSGLFWFRSPIGVGHITHCAELVIP